MRPGRRSGRAVIVAILGLVPGLMGASGVKAAPAPSGASSASVEAQPILTPSSSGLSASFDVAFSSTAPGQGYVLFGPGPGCTGLVGTATQDSGAGTTQHLVRVAGDDMNLSSGAVVPGATYSFEVETVSPSGVEIDNNEGKCYTVTVPSSATAVPCSAAALIAAINGANAAGSGYLRLSAGCTYTLTAAQPDTEDGLPPIRSALTIDGAGATITRSTDPNAPAFRIFEVMGLATLNLRSLTISNGNAPGPEPDGGGGIEVLEQGSLVASSVVVSDNFGALGAGVNNFGSTDIANSVLTGNEALHGAGVSNTSPSGTLRLTNTRISSNHARSDAGVAGGVFNQEGGSASLVNVTVTGNIGDNSAGGIRNDSGSTMDITSSQVSQNLAGPLFNAPTTLTGGGIQNLGKLVLRNTTVDHNHAAKTGPPTIALGGGISNLQSDEQGASPPELTLINSSVSDNVADDGAGGIYNEGGTVALQHTPVTDNVPTNCSGSPTPVPGCSG